MSRPCDNATCKRIDGRIANTLLAGALLLVPAAASANAMSASQFNAALNGPCRSETAAFRQAYPGAWGTDSLTMLGQMMALPMSPADFEFMRNAAQKRLAEGTPKSVASGNLDMCLLNAKRRNAGLPPF